MASPTSSAGLRATIPPLLSAAATTSATPTSDVTGRADPAPVCQATLSTVSVPTTLVNDFWLVLGDHEEDLDHPTPDDTRPLRVQLSEIGQAKGLNVRFLSIEAFIALSPGAAPPSLAIGMLAHGTVTPAGHQMAGRDGRLYPSTQLMEQGRKLGAVAQSVWSCTIGTAAENIAANAVLMSEPGALYDLRGGRQVSSTSQDIVELRDMVAYYADCKEHGICPANVEIYLQSQLRSANSMRLVTPPLAGAAGPGTIGHFPGPKGRALADGMSIKDRLKPASADNAAATRFDFSSHIKPRTQAETGHLLRQRIFRGDVESVRTLIGLPRMEINAQIACQSIPLHLAVGFRQVAVMKELFRTRGIDINARDQKENTPLSRACQLGFADVARALIQAADADGNRMTADINARNESGYSPLYLAAYAGHADVVAELLQIPEIEVNARHRHGQTAFFAACRRGHAQVAQVLLTSKKISGEVKDSVLPAMREACKYHHLNVVAAFTTAPELAEHAGYLKRKLLKFWRDSKPADA